MINIIRTDSSNPDFIELVRQLDAYLAMVDGKDHAFYHQYNGVDSIKHVVVAYNEGKPVACGAIKELTLDAMEVKRMYTLPESRGKGIAKLVLNELEKWASDLSYDKCILETGKQQVEAINLYHKNGYKIIPNYGQYAGVENSICFEKELI